MLVTFLRPANDNANLISVGLHRNSAKSSIAVVKMR